MDGWWGGDLEGKSMTIIAEIMQCIAKCHTMCIQCLQIVDLMHVNIIMALVIENAKSPKSRNEDFRFRKVTYPIDLHSISLKSTLVSKAL